jgi:8-oxo-dGTP pyrophosphatase MutT (NUDIX family)
MASPRIIERKVLHKGGFLEFQQLRTDADTIKYEIFTRPCGLNGLNVLAFTAKKELVLVEEFRPAIGVSVISLVCGVVKPERDPIENARRELLEETGYAGKEAIDLTGKTGPFPASPGVFTERVYSILITDCRKVAVGGGLANEQENIITHLVPLNQLDRFLEKAHAAGKDVFAIHPALGLLYLHYRERWNELMR